MQQTRLESFIEAALSTAIGYAVALVATPLILGAFGWHPSASKNFGITAAFTLLSLVRGYGVRRFCNQHLHRLAVALSFRIRRCIQCKNP